MATEGDRSSNTTAAAAAAAAAASPTGEDTDPSRDTNDAKPLLQQLHDSDGILSDHSARGFVVKAEMSWWRLVA